MRQQLQLRQRSACLGHAHAADDGAGNAMVALHLARGGHCTAGRDLRRLRRWVRYYGVLPALEEGAETRCPDQQFRAPVFLKRNTNRYKSWVAVHLRTNKFIA